MRKTVLTFSVIALTALTFASCKKSDVDAPASAPANVEDIRAFLSKTTGHNQAEITYNAEKGVFVIDKDALMTYQQANEFFKSGSADMPTTQKEQGVSHMKSYYSVTRTKAPAIKVYADASVPATWVAVLDKAILNWNGAGSLINISRVTTPTTTTTTTTTSTSTSTKGPGKGRKSTGTTSGGTTTTTTTVPSYDILITTNYEASSTIATAYYPDINGNPGKQVTINTYHNGLAESYKIFAITHEFGHNLGFAHTNGTYGSLIPGTPTADPSSVMNSVCLSWNGFTTYDLQAFSIVYPK